MIINYFKVLIRNLWKNKFLSLLNILGLAVGMTCYLLIFQYSTYELSYDGFHRHKNDIYRLQRDVYMNNALELSIAATSYNIGPTMKQEYPEVEEVARCYRFPENIVSYKEKKYNDEKIYVSEPSIFTVFSILVSKGDPKTSLSGPNKVMLSESTARKYFGAQDPMGKMLKIANKANEYLCIITGVFKDLPENSHLKFDMLLSLNTVFAANYSDWVFTTFHTYILLTPGTDPNSIKAKLPAFIKKYIVKHVARAAQWEIKLQPLRDIYLYSDLMYDTENGDGKAAYILLIIAFVILVISWINYVNLATARAMERAREVGIRKVIGSSRGQLIKQFLSESVLANIIPIIAAVILFILLVSFLSDLTGKNIPGLTGGCGFWWNLFLMYILGSVLSGLYPAFVLSSFRPVDVLNRSKFSQTASGSFLRESLVVFQFTASVVLIIFSLSVQTQIEYMRNTDLGIDMDKVVGIRLPATRVDQAYIENVTSFETEMLTFPGIESVTASSNLPGSDPLFKRLTWKNGTTPNEGKAVSVIFVDYDFFSTYRIKMAAGRSFAREYGTDQNAVVLNEAAAKSLGFSSPGKALDDFITIFGLGKLKVIGVIKNYHQQSLKKNHDALAFVYGPLYKNYYSLKLNTPHIDETLTKIKDKWDQIFPGYPFEYHFLDDYFNSQYQADRQFGRVLGIFVVLGIIITCLGLLGLTYFSTLQRRKEIAIRKSIGATAADIMGLLTKNIVKLTVIATLAAWPIAYIFTDNWLKDYAFRIGIPLFPFIFSGFLIIFIALLAVAYHTTAAARANPVDALREE
jgi:putative ABC transport system permease protein